MKKTDTQIHTPKKQRKINYDKESIEAQKNTLKEEILQVINENFIKLILDMVNQNVQWKLKKYEDNKNREFEKTQEQIKETIEVLYKYQSETKNTINREMNEIRMKIDKIKKEVTQDMENFRKKNKQKCKTKWKANTID
jgi:hypothetical protein